MSIQARLDDSATALASPQNQFQHMAGWVVAPRAPSEP